MEVAKEWLTVILKDSLAGDSYFHPVRHISTQLWNLNIPVKGSVSRDLRWVLLYINGKLSVRPIIVSQKILSLLKG